MARSSIGDRYVVSLGCRASVEHGLTTTTVKWSVTHLPTGGAPRPKSGDQEISLICPRCTRALAVRVESAARARAKQLVHRGLGWLLLLSLLVTVPLLIDLGGRTVEEGDQRTTDTIGLLVALAAAGAIVGPSLLFSAKVHSGVGKLRLVRDDGTKTALVQGHRLF
ncbi:hypothetical protein ACIRD3_06545 [Kitasatospora sp. NPDC093550]|uniref:hypothetical protein n=1 Tax=Kitasatospora sp. NPDC093550 TaxID=3364089 RepID=UPI003830C563